MNRNYEKFWTQWRSLLLVSFLSFLFFGWIAGSSAQEAARVVIKPEKTILGTSEEMNLAVTIENLNEMYGFEVHLQFDPDVIRIVDADSSESGVQVSNGDLYEEADGFLVINEADNETGKIDYAFTLLAPAEPISGNGTLIEFQIQSVSEGISTLHLVNVILASPGGEPLSFTSSDGQVIVEDRGEGTPTGTQASAPTSSPTAGIGPTSTLVSSATATTTPQINPPDTLSPTVTPTFSTPTAETTISLTPTSIATTPQPTAGTVTLEPTTTREPESQELLETPATREAIANERAGGNRPPSFSILQGSLAVSILAILGGVTYLYLQRRNKTQNSP